MRIGLARAAVVGIAAAILGCGGKVEVDTPGSGGAGGSTATGTFTGTGTTGPMCGTSSCSVGSDGSCQCDGVCDGQLLEVQCAPTQGGASCTCIENSIKIANCIQPGAATCDFVSECCAATFFGQGG